MDTTTDRTANEQPSNKPGTSQTITGKTGRFNIPAWEWAIIGILILTALIPRIVLATQLDMVTDERVYILGGKTYLPLITHASITASEWNYNYEHPPFVKLLIGLFISLNAHTGYLLGELQAARIPSILFGTLLVVAIYWFGRAPFGRIVALLAAFCLAVSPWLVYFSALAYLDMTMTCLITIAYLLLWPAIRQPRLYVLIAALVGLGAASKYTAVLVIPGIVLFTAYYFLALRPKLPAEQRPEVPWRWWLIAVILSPLAFFLFDPAIWREPIPLLIRSFAFEWRHSVGGHLTFLAGQYSGHVPHWAILYIIFAKISAFITIPALFFLIFALIQLGRFHIGRTGLSVEEVSRLAFLFIWVLSILGMFSLLNIVVGTHYHLPVAAPVALAGVLGVAIILRRLLRVAPENPALPAIPFATNAATQKSAFSGRTIILVVLLALITVVPHLVGLTTTYAAEGYTSEFFNGENTALQVAYPGYREAGLWLIAHTKGNGRVGLISISLGTLSPLGPNDISWFTYNQDLIGRLQFTEDIPTEKTYPFDYLIWPMHLVQRGYPLPPVWRDHIVHIVTGGNTYYCYILARDPNSITS